MAAHTYPVFHKALLDESIYPSAKRRIKFEETRHSYLYRTGDRIYVIRKLAPSDSSPALKELHAREALAIGRKWAPQVYVDIAPIVKTDAGFALSQPGEVVDYALVLNQVSTHYWLHNLIPQGKFAPAAVGKLARYLAGRHRDPEQGEISQEAGRPENLRGLTDEIFYQVKKYTGLTVSDALVETVARPMARFIDDNRKLILRRQKKGMVVACHGAFVPEHIFIKGRDIFAVSPLTGSQKYRALDGVNDVAALVNELQRSGAEEQRELFLKRYMTNARDRELDLMLPVYQTFQAMRSGLTYSEALAEEGLEDSARADLIALAHSYFELAVKTSREIPR